MNSPYNGHIPLPHMPQAHFYGAPDIDLPRLSGHTRSYPDGTHSFCAFDTLQSQSLKSVKMGANVLLVGMDGALEVLALEQGKSRTIGQIVGLNGRVLDAKLLNSPTSNDPHLSSRPHVAIILHGPCPPPEADGGASPAGSEANAAQINGSSAGKRAEALPAYQTRAEVYSLRTGDHISTLFACKAVSCHENFPGLPAYAPTPAGNLKLFTSGHFIVLASGVSGEVYIYCARSTSDSTSYQCLGKTWTSVQPRDTRRYSTSSNSTDPDGSHSDSPHSSMTADTPILSLGGRWLAVVSPPAMYRSSLDGSVPASLLQGKAPGLETRNPPAQPAVTCAVDCGDGESLLDKVARGVTQELVKGARWMGDQGLQAWNSYWAKDQPQGVTSRRSSHAMEAPVQGYSLFPPTHAQDTHHTSSSESNIVALVDLKKLEEGGEAKHPLLQPTATFQPPNGCSWLSFSPSGLMLLTASRKGDVQYVWDLMQIKHCRAASLLIGDESSTACAQVRQVARFARLTTSTIVDVVWSPPTGDRLAVVTRKGTVHVFDLPRSAFQWPPFRRSRLLPRPRPAPDSADDQTNQLTAVSSLSAAIKLVGGKTQPLIAAVRNRAPSTGAAFPPVGGFGLTRAASVRSGQVVAAGLSKSVGAAAGTVNTLRHVGENRLHASGLARDPVASRVVWVASKGLPSVGLVDNGMFKLYSIKLSAAVPRNRQRQLHSVIGPREIEYKLPPYLQHACGPIPVSTFAATEPGPTASLALPTGSSHSGGHGTAKCQPLSQAEIETNAPYQPFHTDQRVNLYTLSGENNPADPVSAGQWVFGGEIAMSKLHIRPFNTGRNDGAEAEADDAPGEMENLVRLGNSNGNMEEVVITTRRKKKHALPGPTGSVEDGFFEDDCEVLDFASDRV